MTDACGYYPGGEQPMSLKLPSGRTGVFITDPQLRGTVRAIADADKNATNVEFKTYDISPWGEVAADTGSITRLRLAGQQYDQGARLYYLRARYYDPQLGRFLSEDPIGISGGLNLYAYAGNDPVNAADPSGTQYTHRADGRMCEDWADVTFYYEGDRITGYHIDRTYLHCMEGTEGAGGGSGVAGTMGRAPADTGCKGKVLSQPGIRALGPALQRMSSASGVEEAALIYRESNGFWWGVGVENPITQTSIRIDFQVPSGAWGSIHTHLTGGRAGLYGDYNYLLTHPTEKSKIIVTPDSMYLIPQNPSITDVGGMGVTEACALP